MKEKLDLGEKDRGEQEQRVGEMPVANSAMEGSASEALSWLCLLPSVPKDRPPADTWESAQGRSLPGGTNWGFVHSSHRGLMANRAHYVSSPFYHVSLHLLVSVFFELYCVLTRQDDFSTRLVPQSQPHE